MKKQLVIIGIIALLVSVGLSGCSTQNNDENQVSDKDRFVGTWQVKDIGSIFSFYSDGTYTSGQVSGTWEINNEFFVMTSPDLTEPTQAYTYQFFSGGSSVILTHVETGIEVILIKQ